MANNKKISVEDKSCNEKVSIEESNTKEKNEEPQKKNWGKIILICALIIGFIYLIFTPHNGKNITLSYGNIRDESVPQIEIITDYINIRESKNTNSTILGEVKRGDIYTILSEEEDTYYNWYEIETSNNIRGFIAGKSNGVDYVKELEVIKQDDTDNNEQIEQPPIVDNNNNNSNNNSNSNNNNNSSNNSNSGSNSNSGNNSGYNPPPTPEPTPEPTPSYTIEGIGNVYRYHDNVCRVDAFDTTISRNTDLDFTINFTITMTKLQFDDIFKDCYVKLVVYDSENIVIKTTYVSMDISLNETGRKSERLNISKTGTNNYRIVINPY